MNSCKLLLRHHHLWLCHQRCLKPFLMFTLQYLYSILS